MWHVDVCGGTDTTSYNAQHYHCTVLDPSLHGQARMMVGPGLGSLVSSCSRPSNIGSPLPLCSADRDISEIQLYYKDENTLQL